MIKRLLEGLRRWCSTQQPDAYELLMRQARSSADIEGFISQKLAWLCQVGSTTLEEGAEKYVIEPSRSEGRSKYLGALLASSVFLERKRREIPERWVREINRIASELAESSH